MPLRRLLPALLVATTVSADDAWHHAWSRRLPERQPAWQWNKGMPQDRVYRLVEAGDLVVVGTTAVASVRAYRRSDGGEAWRHHCDGAVRWSPLVAGDTVLAGSDDGTIACLALADGRLRWRYRPGPGTRQSIGHLRMQSSWPIMTVPAVADGVVYGACGAFDDDGMWAFAVGLADASTPSICSSAPWCAACSTAAARCRRVPGRAPSPPSISPPASRCGATSSPRS